MEWNREWPKVSRFELARYVTPQAKNWLALDMNRFDLRGEPYDQRKQISRNIYDTLLARRIYYNREDWHPNESVQIIRTPAEILEAPREGTCLDLAILFCSLCLGYDLLPVLIVLDDHALAVVSLTHSRNQWDASSRKERHSSANGVFTDVTALQNLLNNQCYIAVECTGFAFSEKLGQPQPGYPETVGRDKGLMTFDRAVAAGREQLFARKTDSFFGLDICELQYGQGMFAYELADKLPATAAAPFNPPTVPGYFIPRPELEERVETYLSSENTGSGPRLAAIHGFAGGGKSTLAARIAGDSAVKARFPDAILWTTLGQRPVLLANLNVWLELVGCKRAGDVETATSLLRTALSSKAALLIVDDAWELNHVNPFLMGGPRCSVLITTREVTTAKLAGVPGEALFDIDVMSSDQALALLAKCLGRSISPAERDLALTAAETLAYLPLALQLAAVQIGSEMGARERWAELISDLRDAGRLESLDCPTGEEADEATRKRFSVLASLSLSLRRLSASQREQFAWLGVLAEDFTIASQAASTLWSSDARTARLALRDLQRRALIQESAAAGEAVVYRMHDLLHATARRLLIDPPQPTGEFQSLGIPLVKAHQLLIGRYRELLRNNLWHTLPNDGYMHVHLTRHLRESHACDQVHNLMSEESVEHRNGWYQARERLGQISGYLADLGLAWELAEKRDGENPGEQGRLGSAFLGRQMRYSLMTSSVNTLVGQVIPELAAGLVEKGIWTPDQALANLRQVGDPWQRAEAVAVMAPYLPESYLREAMGLLQPSEDNSAAQALSAMASSLPASLLDDAFAVACRIRPGGWRNHALIALAQRLDDAAMEKTWSLICESGDFASRRDGILQFAQHLPLAFVRSHLADAQGLDAWEADPILACLCARLAELGVPQEGMAFTAHIADSFIQARARAQCAIKYPEPEKTQIVSELFASALANAVPAQQAALFVQLAPALPEGLLQQALNAVRTIEEPWDRGEELAAIGEYLPAAEREEVLNEAFELRSQVKREGPNTSRLGLISVLDRVNVVGSQRLFESACKAIVDRNNPGETKQALEYLLPSLDQSQIDYAFQAVRRMSNAEAQVSGLKVLLPKLGPAALEEAENLAANIQDGALRAQALAAIISRSDGAPQKNLSLRLMEAVRAAEGDWSRTQAIQAAAAVLPDGMIAEALDLLPAIHAQWWRAEALASLMPRVTETLLAKAIAIAESPFDREDERTPALRSLALRQAELRMIPEALATIAKIASSDERSKTLELLVRDLVERGGLRNALAASQAIADASDRTETLLVLAPLLPETTLGELLEEIRSLPDTERQFEALKMLAPALPETLMDRALSLLEGIPITRRRADSMRPGEVIRETDLEPKVSAFDSLVPHLPEALMARALAFPDGLPAEPDPFRSPRSQALAAVAPRLAGTLLEDAIQKAHELKDGKSRACAFAALAMRKAQIGKPDEACALIRLIDGSADGEWSGGVLNRFVSVAPFLPDSMIETILPVIESIGDPEAQARLLVELSLGLAKAKRFPQAIEIGGRVADSRMKAWLYCDLASFLPEGEKEAMLARALETARAMKNLAARASVLARLVPELPRELQHGVARDALDDALHGASNETHLDILENIGPYLATLQDADRDFAFLFSRTRDSKFVDRLHVLLASLLAGSGQYAKAFAQIESVAEESTASAWLIAEAPRLPDDVLHDAFAFAQKMTVPYHRFVTMAVVVLELPEPERAGAFDSALSAARTIDEPYPGGQSAHDLALRSRAFQEVLMRMAGRGNIDRAVSIACEIDDREVRAPSLRALLSRLAASPVDSWYPTWCSALHKLAQRSRRDLLSDLAAISPALAELSDREIASEVASAIADVGRWWP